MYIYKFECVCLIFSFNPLRSNSYNLALSPARLLPIFHVFLFREQYYFPSWEIVHRYLHIRLHSILPSFLDQYSISFDDRKHSWHFRVIFLISQLSFQLHPNIGVNSIDHWKCTFWSIICFDNTLSVWLPLFFSLMCVLLRSSSVKTDYSVVTTKRINDCVGLTSGMFLWVLPTICISLRGYYIYIY